MWHTGTLYRGSLFALLRENATRGGRSFGSLGVKSALAALTWYRTVPYVRTVQLLLGRAALRYCGGRPRVALGIS